jgi:hypothetical protein
VPHLQGPPTISQANRKQSSHPNQQQGRTNNVIINNCTVTQQHPPDSNSFPRAYSQVASGQNPDTITNVNSSLSNFPNEF